MPRAPEVEVWVGNKTGKATYHGLTTCGSVWACPVCSAKIAERRRLELEAAIKANQAQDEDAYTCLLTLTIPHTRADDLGELLAKLRKANDFLHSGRAWQTFKEQAGVIGTITALEVTHGQNGWHPHLHVLVFTQGCEDFRHDEEWLPYLEGLIYRRWLAACRRAGLPDPSEGHGVRLHGGNRASAYVAKFGSDGEVRKWGLAEELTRAHSKRGKNGSRTPWDILRSILLDGEAQDVTLFQEFFRAFKGRQQLRWSRGLRALLGLVVERSDEDLAAEAAQDAWHVGSLTLSQWRVILAREDRAAVLLVVEREGWPGVERYFGEVSHATG